MALTGSTEIDVILRSRADVAESPVWDDRERCLWWVDIHAELLHRFDPAGGVDRSWSMDRPLGSVALRGDGGLLVALADGIATFDTASPVPAYIAGLVTPGARLNDGGCDHMGRFWVGSMVENGPAGGGALYRLERGGPMELVMGGVTISNGLDWSPDGSTFYYVDSASEGVDAFDFDVETGAVDRRRRLISVNRAEGLADGLTVDAEGHLWLAICGGAEIRRYTPEGRHELSLRLPVTRVTSCAFGGDDLEELYVTSARRHLSDAQLHAQPLAGSVFRLRPGVRGLPVRRFRA